MELAGRGTRIPTANLDGGEKFTVDRNGRSPYAKFPSHARTYRDARATPHQKRWPSPDDASKIRLLGSKRSLCPARSLGYKAREPDSTLQGLELPFAAEHLSGMYSDLYLVVSGRE